MALFGLLNTCLERAHKVNDIGRSLGLRGHDFFAGNLIFDELLELDLIFVLIVFIALYDVPGNNLFAAMGAAFFVANPAVIFLVKLIKMNVFGLRYKML